MAFLLRINPFSKSNPDTGFGTQAGRLGERFINKDGSFNLKKTGYPFWKKSSLYSTLMKLTWLQFLGLILASYILINILFTSFYLMAGFDQFAGMLHDSRTGKMLDLFFFSTQTFTTVGYGRINPVGLSADLIASAETMLGWMFFAMVTGLLYGRFTRPQAYLAFSENALIAPYKNGKALMFRVVPYKNNHHLVDASVVVNLALQVMKEGKPEYMFYTLGLERNRVDSFAMNWTVVHPIDDQSPLIGLKEPDFATADLELYVQLSGFDPVFSNTVMQRTSYTFREIIWNARFRPMYYESEDGSITIIDISRLNEHEKLNQG
jgi:inward rectifier potassium channel